MGLHLQVQQATYSTYSTLIIMSVSECYFTFEALYIAFARATEQHCALLFTMLLCEMLRSMHIYMHIIIQRNMKNIVTQLSIMLSDCAYELHIHGVRVRTSMCTHTHVCICVCACTCILICGFM